MQNSLLVTYELPFFIKLPSYLSIYHYEAISCADSDDCDCWSWRKIREANAPHLCTTKCWENDRSSSERYIPAIPASAASMQENLNQLSRCKILSISIWHDAVFRRRKLQSEYLGSLQRKLGLVTMLDLPSLQTMSRLCNSIFSGGFQHSSPPHSLRIDNVFDTLLSTCYYYKASGATDLNTHILCTQSVPFLQYLGDSSQEDEVDHEDQEDVSAKEINSDSEGEYDPAEEDENEEDDPFEGIEFHIGGPRKRPKGSELPDFDRLPGTWDSIILSPALTFFRLSLHP